MKYTDAFLDLIALFVHSNDKYREVYPASIAQFILESGRGTSLLAKEHKNFAGMKWRPELKGLAKKVLVEAPSETAYFCSFDSIADFAKGYWVFLDREPYEGWEKHASDPFEFIDFVAPIWAADRAYAEKLRDLIGEAESLVFKYSDQDDEIGGSNEEAPPCCPGMADDISESEFSRSMELRSKPPVKWDPSPFNWSRGGTDIDTIVMHYTTSRSLSGTVSWFKDKKKNKDKTAAHYVIGRIGEIVQMVKDEDACTHGNSQNRRSIGIEHSAATGDKMTAEQEESSVALVRWLMQEYDVKAERVIGHKCAPRKTRCPGDLFKEYGATHKSDCATVTKAIQAWIKDKVL